MHVCEAEQMNFLARNYTFQNMPFSQVVKKIFSPTMSTDCVWKTSYNGIASQKDEIALDLSVHDQRWFCKYILYILYYIYYIILYIILYYIIYYIILYIILYIFIYKRVYWFAFHTRMYLVAPTISHFK